MIATNKTDITLGQPVLSILEFTALDPFIDDLQVVNFIDGFDQRFGYIPAHTVPNRKMVNIPNKEVNSDGWKAFFQKMTAQMQAVYKTHHGAEQAFLRTFREPHGRKLYRRVMWRAHQYAFIY